jgi:hypothetical protein
VIEIFAGKFTKDQILWEIPLVELNQLVHVYLRRQGNICRRRGSVDALDERFDALCAVYGK